MPSPLTISQIDGSNREQISEVTDHCKRALMLTNVALVLQQRAAKASGKMQRLDEAFLSLGDLRSHCYPQGWLSHGQNFKFLGLQFGPSNSNIPRKSPGSGWGMTMEILFLIQAHILEPTWSKSPKVGFCVLCSPRITEIVQNI